MLSRLNLTLSQADKKLLVCSCWQCHRVSQNIFSLFDFATLFWYNFCGVQKLIAVHLF